VKSFARPRPPQDLVEPAEGGPTDSAASFVAAPELGEWARTCFLEPGGPLENEDHKHLREAHILFLWTNVPKVKDGRERWAEAHLVRPSGDKWVIGRALQQLRDWYGTIPHFVIIVSAPVAVDLDDATFGALVDHELYHCFHQVDRETGEPRMNEFDEYVWAMRGHDVEQFIGVARRWGGRASGVDALLAAAAAPPLLGEAEVALACGTCR
jgi:hypothetical protein